MNDWASLVRQYLALREKRFLTDALALVRKEASVSSNRRERSLLDKLTSLLEAFLDVDYTGLGNIPQELEARIEEGQKLVAGFDKIGRNDLSNTVRLLCMEPTAALVSRYIHLPMHLQGAALGSGINVCGWAAALSKELGDAACTAFYLLMMGTGYVRSVRFEAARGSFEKALDIYQQLATEQPELYLPRLAMTLNSLGAMLAELQEFEAAKERFREGVRIYQKLAVGQPDRYLPEVAMTLENLGIVLRELREFEASKESHKEAVEIYQQLKAQQPEAYLLRLAGALRNLGDTLGELGDFEAAKESLEKALEKYQQLAVEQPKWYLPEVAETLNSLGNVQEKPEEAKENFEKALDIYRQLIAEQPEAPLPLLGVPLSSLGIRQRDLSEEMMGVCRQLDVVHLQLYLSKMATTLSNLGNVHYGLQEFIDAKERYKEAVDIYRQLVAIHPRYLHGLAKMLNNLGNLQRELEEFEVARENLREAIALLGAPSFTLDRAGPLYNLALLEEALGKGAESVVRLYEQAVQSCEEGLFRLGEKEWQHRDVFKGEIEHAYLALIEHNARREGKEAFRKLFGLIESLRNVESLADFGMPERSPLGIAVAQTQEMRRQKAKREVALARGEELAQIDAEIQSLGKNAAGAREKHIEEVLEEAQGILEEHRCAFLAVQATREGEAVFLSITPEGHRVDVADKGFLEELDALLVEIETGIHQLAERTRAPAVVVRDLWRVAQRVPRKGKTAFSRLPLAVQELLKDERYQTLFLAPCGRTVNHPFQLLESPDGSIGLTHLMPRVHGFSALVDVLKRQPLYASENGTALVVGNPLHENAPPLLGAQAASIYVANRLKQQNYSLLPDDETLLQNAATEKAFLAAFEKKPDFAFYNGHGGRDAGGEYLALAGKGEVRPQQIIGFDLSHHPVIHYDCCVAGTSHYLRGGRFDGHSSAVMLAGASCCLSSVHPIFDEPSCAFTCRLYDKLLNADNPATFGEALLKTRQEMADEYSGNPLAWGLQMFWGNPFVRLI